MSHDRAALGKLLETCMGARLHFGRWEPLSEQPTQAQKDEAGVRLCEALNLLTDAVADVVGPSISAQRDIWQSWMDAVELAHGAAVLNASDARQYRVATDLGALRDAMRAGLQVWRDSRTQIEQLRAPNPSKSEDLRA